MPSTAVNFEGVNNLNGVLPPDTNGDVGPNHYVQRVNRSLAIYSRSGDCSMAHEREYVCSVSPAPAKPQCGDPIVLYDEGANRWILTQFALPNYPRGPFYQCIAVWASEDPTGDHYRDQFSFTKMNDYPNFGVWPDGYYMAINQFAARTGVGPGRRGGVRKGQDARGSVCEDGLLRHGR